MAKLRKGAAEGVIIGTESVREEALRLILRTPKSGRIYRRRGVEHQASAPGEAPASDTGRLVGSITTRYENDNLRGFVQAATRYTRFLEFGTSKMAPRPYMRPALANKIQEVEARIAAKIREVLS